MGCALVAAPVGDKFGEIASSVPNSASCEFIAGDFLENSSPHWKRVTCNVALEPVY